MHLKIESSIHYLFLRKDEEKSINSLSNSLQVSHNCQHPYFNDLINEFWELGRHEKGIRIKRSRGVDGVVVSYPQ